MENAELSLKTGFRTNPGDDEKEDPNWEIISRRDCSLEFWGVGEGSDSALCFLESE